MQLDDSAIWHESYPLKAFYFSRQKKNRRLSESHRVLIQKSYFNRTPASYNKWALNIEVNRNPECQTK